jgi:hypothetical protein
MFVSTTIQLVQDSIVTFEQWVDHIINKTKLPPCIFIDEAHTGSEGNKWGGAVKRLVEAGAYAVLLTATPIRSDGYRIPGFDFEILEESATKVRLPNRIKDAPEGWMWIDLMEGMKQKIKLVAHHETTFRDAWNENPSCLCRVSRVPFDVDLSKITTTKIEDKQLLSELSPSDIRQYLGKIVRDPMVVRKGSVELVKEVHQSQTINENCAAIVFSANDNNTKLANEHACLIRKNIEDIDSNMNVVIATASDGNEGTKKIEAFAKESSAGDVLIVKQMASLGLDAPRVKNILDLSPTRTVPAFIQRMTRGGTVYENMKRFTYISPDDCLNQALFQLFITENGGEMSSSELELVDSYLIEKKKEEDKKMYFINGTLGADFEDSDCNRGEANQLPEVREIFKALPELSAILTHSEVAERLKNNRIHVETSAEIEDTGEKIEDICYQINTIAKKIVLNRLGGYNSSKKAEYEKLIRDTWNRAKQLALGDISIELSKITNLGDLKVLKQAIIKMAVSEGIEC